MAIKTVNTYYNGGDCFQSKTVDDANELLDIGLGQFIPDHEPGQQYSILAPCGTKCDNEGKTWTNCEGYPSNASSAGSLPKMPKWVLPAVGVVIVFIVFIYFKKKK
jgi:hypothetical protein